MRTKPSRTASGREKIRTKMDSGACEPVINPETAADYPITETEASKKGVAFVSASGDPMPNMGGRILVVRKPCVPSVPGVYSSDCRHFRTLT